VKNGSVVTQYGQKRQRDTLAKYRESQALQYQTQPQPGVEEIRGISAHSLRPHAGLIPCSSSVVGASIAWVTVTVSFGLF
jgi:hypothetical protein